MPWPVDDLSTAGVDSGADRPPRAEFFKLFQRVKTVIGARGTADGVASLDGTGRVPAAQLPPAPTLPDAVPPGTIAMHGGARPSGWLNCSGSAVSRTTYPELFAAIGTRYGQGDGSTTFNVPDLRGRFPLGSTSSVVLGDTGGEAAHTLTVDEMPEHAHELGGVRQDGGTGADRNKLVGTTGVAAIVPAASTYGVRNSGGGQAHNNMPPYLNLNFIIKV